MARPRHCGIPHPKFGSYKCQRPEGHEGDHVASKVMHNGSRRLRIWKRQLTVYTELMKGVF